MSAEGIAEQRREKLSAEMYWAMLPVEEWLDKCVPGGALPSNMQFQPFSIEWKKQEGDMYMGLLQGFEGLFKAVGGEDDFIVRITDSHPDTITQGSVDAGDVNSHKLDLVVYERTLVAELATEVPPTRWRHKGKTQGQAQSAVAPAPEVVPLEATNANVPNATTSDAAAGPSTTSADPFKGHTKWALAEFFIEVTNDSSMSPFSFDPEDPNGHPLPQGSKHASSRGQIIEYGNEIFSRQHRTFVVVISVYCNYARFIRLDRIGATISQPFDYVARPNIFGLFLYRYTRMSPEERGFDPTSTRASDADAAVFRALAGKYPALAKAATPGWPIHELTINAPWITAENRAAAVRGDIACSPRKFLIGRPSYRSHSMSERGTRGFVAWDVTQRTAVFIKDYWRADIPELYLTEYETYLKLWESPDSDMFIPTLLGGGDVVLNPDGKRQLTLTDTFFTEPALPGRVHTRLVLKEVCRPLTSFKESRELVSVLYDALRGKPSSTSSIVRLANSRKAHKRAWEDCHFLHRDISAGNILIYDVGGSSSPKTIGLLADWDLASTKEQVEHPVASLLTRSGTWQFISGALLNYPNKPHLLSDDLESVYHVLNWCALKYLPHNLTHRPAALAAFMDMHYDLAYLDVSEALGSIETEKFYKIVDGSAFVRGLPEDHPFEMLRSALAELFKRHYREAEMPLQRFTVTAEPKYADLIAPWAGSTAGNLPLDSHALIMDEFLRVLNLPQEQWPPITKLADQAPHGLPSSTSIGIKRSAGEPYTSTAEKI
ncbi:hypothetical protein C8Q78DRAFT_1077680 [Trametes maxima]|nr:hypothetical protein C8Q78DRAFT_1077680 [Trametes maxima]